MAVSPVTQLNDICHMKSIEIITCLLLLRQVMMWCIKFALYPVYSAAIGHVYSLLEE